AVPSLIIGYLAIEPMLFGQFFDRVIFVDASMHPAMSHLTHHFHEILHSPAGMALHGFFTLPFALALSGVVLSWFFYMKRPDIPAAIQAKCKVIYQVLENKYGFDAFNERVFAGGSRFIGNKFWQIGDVQLIDGAMVNGTANLVGKISAKVRHLQSGLIYHYAFAMIIGVFLFLTFFDKIN
ncbi:MAG TPA: NADH-quinone oxidoreductase subunit L, partial [Methylophilaceae bacterium]|nr:NADH-quinone oxidoreductase subunit L [Methylophilaceae bacterium]